jgi:hypothetical protein
MNGVVREHLCVRCPFALEVWDLVQAWSRDLVTLPLGKMQVSKNGGQSHCSTL